MSDADTTATMTEDELAGAKREVHLGCRDCDGWQLPLSDDNLEAALAWSKSLFMACEGAEHLCTTLHYDLLQGGVPHLVAALRAERERAGELERRVEELEAACLAWQVEATRW